MPLVGLIIIFHDLYTTGIRTCGGLALLSLLLPLIAAGLGARAHFQIKEGKKPLKGGALAWLGILSPVIVLGAIFFLSDCVVPKNQTYYDLAETCGQSAQIAQMTHYANQPEDQKHYTANLDQLLSHDKYLKNYQGVTFVFLKASQSEFAFYTAHPKDREKRKIYFYKLNPPPLFQAVCNGQIDEVKKLIEKGADVNEPPGCIPVKQPQKKKGWGCSKKTAYEIKTECTGAEYGRTPLHQAAYDGNLEIAKLLVEKGANIEAVNIYRRTPLHLAAQTGQVQVVKYLLSKGVKINPRDSEHLTPLFYANCNRFKKNCTNCKQKTLTVKLLMAHGGVGM